MSSDSITVLIPARNAAATIDRAVRSALAQGDCEILLLDHSSTDGTADLARQVAGDRLRVLPVKAGASIGGVRQSGLDVLQTEFGVWLDADDEMVPDRCGRLVAALKAGSADLAFDEIDLHDGATGRFLRRLAFPHSFQSGRDLARCFERNYVPGPGVPAFRTVFARSVGYDAQLLGAEDYDFLLRAVMVRAKTCLVREALYRQFAYGSSLSRQIENQREMCARALRKHDPSDVHRLLHEAGLEEAERLWALVCFFVFRGELSEALIRLEAATEVREKHLEDQWRCEFERATLLLALGRTEESLTWLHRSESTMESAEGANNLGVAMARLGHRTKAAQWFETALERFAGYRDAAHNRTHPGNQIITMLPLRTGPARADYA